MGKGRRTKSRTNAEIVEEITAGFIADLERGVAPWVKPWDASAPLELPKNLKTGKAYRGSNVMFLWAAQEKLGYERSLWLTYRQAKAMKGHVRKGEKGVPLMFWKLRERTETNDAGEEVEVKIPLARTFTVFNIAQCEGLGDNPEEAAKPAAALRLGELLERHEVEVIPGGTRAYYRPSTDRIHMPTLDRFRSEADYESTLAHEVVHWSGHESRCARDFRGRFGDAAYAFEELVAELGSAFLCARLGIVGQLQHASYLASWAKILKDDPYALLRAAREAQRAFDFLTVEAADADAEEERGVGRKSEIAKAA